MMLTATPPAETLADVLGARARRTPTDRLVLDIVGGLLIAAASIWARQPAWFPLVAACACFVFYGCWALTERRAHTSATTGEPELSPAWTMFRQASAALGIIAFLTLMFALLGLGLGPIIS